MAASSSSQHPGISSLNPSGYIRPTSRITTEFSSSTKHKIERFTDVCWACEAVSWEDTQHAHIISQADRFQFLEDMQILDFEVSSAVQNGIILCFICHRNFDNHLNPSWVFYPSDLDFFIDFELEDRRARVSNSRSRKVPDSAAYLQHQKNTSAVDEVDELPLYVRRVLAPEGSMNVRAISGERGWHGHPIAAIRSAWRALGALRGNRIPLEDRAKLSYLLDLYRTPPGDDVTPPAGLPPRPPPPPSDDHDSEEDTTKGKKGKGKGKSKAVEKQGTKRPAPRKGTRASERKRGRGAGAVGKGRQMRRESMISSELIEKKRTQPPDIIHWLDKVEDRNPPNTPPAPELA